MGTNSMRRAAALFAVVIGNVSIGCGPDDRPVADDRPHESIGCDLTPIDSDGTLPACALTSSVNPVEQQRRLDTLSQPQQRDAIEAANKLAKARRGNAASNLDLGFGGAPNK